MRVHSANGAWATRSRPYVVALHQAPDHYRPPTESPRKRVGAPARRLFVDGDASFVHSRRLGGLDRQGTVGLVLGAPRSCRRLRIVGVTSLHVTQDARAIVMGLVDALRTDQVPLFAPRWRRPVRQVRPESRAEVGCLERTPTGMLRHASVRQVTPMREMT